MTGTLQMNTNTITGVVAGAAGSTNAANVAQMEAADLLKASRLQTYDPTATSAFPTTWGGVALVIGHRFYISVAGTMAAGTVVVEVGDIIEARAAAATNAAADWSVIQANSVQATTTVLGIGTTATNAEAVSKASTTDFLTPSNLATGNFQASATFEGLIELATQAEVDAETDATRAVTAATLAGKAATDWKKFVGLTNVLAYSAGTWTRTRVAASDYVQRKTAAVDTTIIGIDITDEYRTASLRGYKLNNFNIIYRNTTADLTGHSINLDAVSYTDTGVVTITNVPLNGGGTLLFTQNANPRVQTKEITTPAYFIAGHKYVMELTVTSAATSVYDFIGIILNFTKTAS